MTQVGIRPILLFSFCEHGELIQRTVRLLENQSFTPHVINLSSRTEIPTAEGIPIKHISQYCNGREVNEARRLAVEWMQQFPMHKLEFSQKSFLETFKYKDIPLWWLFEISLQEKAFLVIRMVERVQKIIQSESARYFAILGSHPSQPWQRLLIEQICQETGLTYHPLEQEEKLLQVAEEQSLESAETQEEVRMSPNGDVPRFIERVRTLWEKVWYYYLGVGIFGVNRIIGLGVAVVAGLLLVPLYFLFLAILIFTMLSTPWQAPLREIFRLSLARLRSLLDHKIWQFRMVSAVKLSLRLLAHWKLQTREAASKAAKSRILVVIDQGNIKNRLNLMNGQRSEYNPYLEGILERLRQQISQIQSSSEILVAAYGTRLPSTNPFARLREHLRLIPDPTHLDIRDFLTEDVQRNAKLLAKECEKHWKQLIHDQGFRRAFFYRETDLWDSLAPDFEWAFTQVTPESILYLEAFRKLLQKVRPSLVMMYNYEGALRKLCAAALIEKIPCLGIQQALGPYGHALNHRTAGYAYLTSPDQNTGCPIPSKIALWGEYHRTQLLANYGYPQRILEVTGYARLDTYVIEKQLLDRETILHKLSLASAKKIILFAGVCQAAGTNIMLEDNYIATFRKLVRVANEVEGVYVMVKPWGGDNLPFIRKIVRRYGNSKVLYIAPGINVHNIELLRISDVVLVDLSSLLAEAWIMDNVCVLLDYPESRYYFNDEHLAAVKDLAWRVTHPNEVFEMVVKALAMNKEALAREKHKARQSFEALFGVPDGRAAERIARLALELSRPVTAQAHSPQDSMARE